MDEALPLIDRFKVTAPYRLRLWFSDGRSGDWDFSHLAADDRPVTAPFKDPAFFSRVFLDYGALTWTSGYDLSPVALHDDMMAADALSFEASRAA